MIVLGIVYLHHGTMQFLDGCFGFSNPEIISQSSFQWQAAFPQFLKRQFEDAKTRLEGRRAWEGDGSAGSYPPADFEPIFNGWYAGGQVGRWEPSTVPSRSPKRSLPGWIVSRILFEQTEFKTELFGLGEDIYVDDYLGTGGISIWRHFAETFFKKNQSFTGFASYDVRLLVQTVVNHALFWENFDADVEDQIQKGTAVREVKEVGNACCFACGKNFS